MCVSCSGSYFGSSCAQARLLVLALPMPMACAQSYCTEAARAAALASHSAASLAAAAGFREAARLLRSSEALARAATAALLAVPSHPRQLPHADVPVAAAAVDAGAEDAVKSKKRRSKKKKKDASKKQSENMAVDTLQLAKEVPGAPLAAPLQPAPSTPSACTLAVQPVPPGRSLKLRTSRERSPHRASSSLSLSSPPSSTPPTLGFAVGQSVLLFDLVSRADLNGKIGSVRSFDASDSRYAIDVVGSSVPVRVRAQNIRNSIFAAG